METVPKQPAKQKPSHHLISPKSPLRFTFHQTFVHEKQHNWRPKDTLKALAEAGDEDAIRDLEILLCGKREERETWDEATARLRNILIKRYGEDINELFQPSEHENITRRKAQLQLLELIEAKEWDEKTNRHIYRGLSKISANEAFICEEPVGSEILTLLEGVISKIRFSSLILLDKCLRRALLPVHGFCKEQGILLEHIVYEQRRNLEKILLAIVQVYRGVVALKFEKDVFSAKAHSMAGMLKAVCYTAIDVAKTVGGNKEEELPTLNEMIFELMTSFGLSEATVVKCLSSAKYIIGSDGTVRLTRTKEIENSGETITGNVILEESDFPIGDPRGLEAVGFELRRKEWEKNAKKAVNETDAAEATDADLIDYSDDCEDQNEDKVNNGNKDVSEPQENQKKSDSIDDKLNEVNKLLEASFESSLNFQKALAQVGDTHKKVMEDFSRSMEQAQRTRDKIATDANIVRMESTEESEIQAQEELFSHFCNMQNKVNQSNIAYLQRFIDAIQDHINAAKEVWWSPAEKAAADLKRKQMEQQKIIDMWISKNKQRCESTVHRFLIRLIKYYKRIWQRRRQATKKIFVWTNFWWFLYQFNKKKSRLRLENICANIICKLLYRRVISKRKRITAAIKVQRFFRKVVQVKKMRQAFNITKEAIFKMATDYNVKIIGDLTRRMQRIERFLEDILPEHIVSKINGEIAVAQTNLPESIDNSSSLNRKGSVISPDKMKMKSSTILETIEEMKNAAADIKYRLGFAEEEADAFRLAISSSVRIANLQATGGEVEESLFSDQVDISSNYNTKKYINVEKQQQYVSPADKSKRKFSHLKNVGKKVSPPSNLLTVANVSKISSPNHITPMDDELSSTSSFSSQSLSLSETGSVASTNLRRNFRKESTIQSKPSTRVKKGFPHKVNLHGAHPEKLKMKQKNTIDVDDDADNIQIIDEYTKLVNKGTSLKSIKIFDKIAQLSRESNALRMAVEENESNGLRESVLTINTPNDKLKKVQIEASIVDSNNQTSLPSSPFNAKKMCTNDTNLPCVVAQDRFVSDFAIHSSSQPMSLSSLNHHSYTTDNMIRGSDFMLAYMNHNRVFSSTDSFAMIEELQHQNPETIQDEKEKVEEVKVSATEKAIITPPMQCHLLLWNMRAQKSEFEDIFQGRRAVSRDNIWLSARVTDIFQHLSDILVRGRLCPKVDLQYPPIVPPLGFTLQTVQQMDAHEYEVYSLLRRGMAPFKDSINAKGISVRTIKMGGRFSAVKKIQESLKCGNDGAILNSRSDKHGGGGGGGGGGEEDNLIDSADLSLSGATNVDLKDLVLTYFRLNADSDSSCGFEGEVFDFVAKINEYRQQTQQMSTGPITATSNSSSHIQLLCHLLSERLHHGPSVIFSSYVLTICAHLHALYDKNESSSSSSSQLRQEESQMSVPKLISLRMAIEIIQYIVGGISQHDWLSSNEICKLAMKKELPVPFQRALEGILQVVGVKVTDSSQTMGITPTKSANATPYINPLLVSKSLTSSDASTTATRTANPSSITHVSEPVLDEPLFEIIDSDAVTTSLDKKWLTGDNIGESNAIDSSTDVNKNSEFVDVVSGHGAHIVSTSATVHPSKSPYTSTNEDNENSFSSIHKSERRENKNDSQTSFLVDDVVLGVEKRRNIFERPSNNCANQSSSDERGKQGSLYEQRQEIHRKKEEMAQKEAREKRLYEFASKIMKEMNARTPGKRFPVRDFVEISTISPYNLVLALLDAHLDQSKQVNFVLTANELFRSADPFRLGKITRKEFRRLVLSLSTNKISDNKIADIFNASIRGGNIQMCFPEFCKALSLLQSEGVLDNSSLSNI